MRGWYATSACRIMPRGSHATTVRIAKGKTSARGWWRTEVGADGDAAHDVGRGGQAPRVLQRRCVHPDARREGADDVTQAPHQVPDLQHLCSGSELGLPPGLRACCCRSTNLLTFTADHSILTYYHARGGTQCLTASVRSLTAARPNEGRSLCGPERAVPLHSMRSRCGFTHCFPRPWQVWARGQLSQPWCHATMLSTCALCRW